MWYVSAKRKPDWSRARRELSRADKTLARIVKKVGPCTLVPRRDYFIVLCVSIFNQQISTKIATILFNRFKAQFPRKRITPTHALKLLQQDAACRACGLSRQKRGYLIDLSQKFIDRTIPVRKLAKMSDEEVIESLTQIKGIGQWTAEMFLMFVLNRPDVLPVDDLGLQEAVKRIYKLPARPTKAELREMGEKWRPWRTIATWYLWRRLEG